MKSPKLENQLCFALYALSRQVTSLYRPMLDQMDLTYPQYLVMLLLWEQKQISVKDMGARLWLDSGTLTPLLKRLEQKGLITRKRSSGDERLVDISVTEKGLGLEQYAQKIPQALGIKMCITEQQSIDLQQQLYQLLTQITPETSK